LAGNKNADHVVMFERKTDFIGGAAIVPSTAEPQARGNVHDGARDDAFKDFVLDDLTKPESRCGP